MSLPAAIICTCPTDSSGYWQAAAIFFTGVAAVWAAWHIGNGQNKISLLERRYDFIKEMSVELYSSINDHERPTDFRLILRNSDMAELMFRRNDIERLAAIVEEIQKLNRMKFVVQQATGPKAAAMFAQRVQEYTDKQTKIEADLKDVLNRLKRYAEVKF